MTEKQKKKLNIEETKKSLPIYKFKKDLIRAIKDHQVIILFQLILHLIIKLFHFIRYLS